jgi:spore coat polysaccharide biosynthesis predicted glycosyltransferase SpsG
VDDLTVVVPASKKMVVFPDDLMRRMDGVRLIERAVALASAVVAPDRIVVLTDSEELEAVVRPLGVRVHRDPSGRTTVATVWQDPAALATELAAADAATEPGAEPEANAPVLVLSPYAPLVPVGALRGAVERLTKSGVDLVVAAASLTVRSAPTGLGTWAQLRHDLAGNEVASVVTAFVVVRRGVMAQGAADLRVATHPLDAPVLEIRSYEDWWTCERLLQRRRVVFHVVGSLADGTGHVHRSLTLARELHDHDVRFICDRDSQLAADLIADAGHPVEVCDRQELVGRIVALGPDLVVSDALDTTLSDVRAIRASGARVVTFEDHGSGSAEADLVVHELLDDVDDGDPRVLSGPSWFVLREEFAEVVAHRVPSDVRRVLVTFGGTDPGDFTRQVVEAIAPWCAERGIAIDVVTGPGYLHVDALAALVSALPGEITRTHATGVISRLMADAQIAVCANGRTPYELAHLHVPAVVVTQNAREEAHPFAEPANGFVRIDGSDGRVGPRVLAALTRMVDDVDHRHRLFEAMHGFDLSGNRRRLVERLTALAAGRPAGEHRP